MDTSISKIKSLIKQKIGLDSSTIGDNTLEKIISRRMLKCDINKHDDYYDFLNNNSDELNELLEIAVIPETWFFRDIRPFETICKNIKDGLIKNRNKVFRILSLPCSTGEEPYSLSMYLINKNIPESAFTINAVDVSPRALELAQEGKYKKNSFRGKHYPEYQEKCFTYADDVYTIKKRFSDKVSFKNLNILYGDISFHDKFDFILCRNLLIYFDEKTKLKAFKKLEKFMKEHAILYIGHSEFGAIPSNTFENTGSDNAFGLIKHNPKESNTVKSGEIKFNEMKPNEIKSSGINPSKIKPRINSRQEQDLDFHIKKQPAASVFEKTKSPPPQNTPTNKTNSLDEIRNLADLNDFKQAERLCKRYIEENNEDTESLHLLGLISSKLKNDVAESLFRKALFLNPKHYESLIHLAIILEDKGDLKSAELLKKRAKKTITKNGQND